MSYEPKSSYLDNKVTTSNQPRLHLMLLEGAVRHGQLARQAWEVEAKYSEVELAMSKMIDIVEELTCAVRKCDSEVSKQLEDQYAAIFRQLVFCQMNRDRERLDACLELLEFHRETWRLLCEKIEFIEEKSPAVVPTPRATINPSPIIEGFSCEA